MVLKIQNLFLAWRPYRLPTTAETISYAIFRISSAILFSYWIFPHNNSIEVNLFRVTSASRRSNEFLIHCMVSLSVFSCEKRDTHRTCSKFHTLMHIITISRLEIVGKCQGYNVFNFFILLWADTFHMEIQL